MNIFQLEQGREDVGSGVLTPVAGLWEQKEKEKSGLPKLRVWREDWNKRGKKLEFGPGGGAGIGCGAGIGFALVGGAGVGSEPWNSFKFVFGIGAGCGVGIGYGFGHGFGVRWDRRPKKKSEKRIVFEI